MRRDPLPVGAIVRGDITGAEAYWQLGRYHLSHTNDMLAIRAGDKVGPEYAGGSTDTNGLWSEIDRKGIRFETSEWREPRTDAEQKLALVNTASGAPQILDRTIAWKCAWGPLVELVKPILSDDTNPLTIECLDAQKARRDHTATQPAPWSIDTPDERSARFNAWSRIEDRCYAAAAAVWNAVRPNPEPVQPTLW